MLNKFHGQQRENILRRLVQEWLPGGPPTAILQGFPGCGKSQLAVAVAERTDRSLDPIDVQSDGAGPLLDLFTDLALALDAKGLPQLMQEVDKGAGANLARALLEILRREQVLIVIDEFQRLLPKDKTTPPAPWARMVEELNNSPRPQGRLLLVSNRSIKTERWCENCHIEEVRGLPDQEAEALFSELLELQGLAAAVPPGKRLAIVRRLGGNPRALKTLMVGLRTDSLEDLLSAAPDLKKPGDVVLDPQLVEAFEREVLERALPKLEADLLKFMRWLSVHRRPFQKEALAQFTGGRETPEALRKQLFDRFLLDRTAGGDVPHPLAREISVSRLRAEQGEWVQAHNLAANYHFRHFKARQLTGASTLAASYAELRHHLYEAGRIGELHEASERLTKYALSQVVVTRDPTNKEALEERIALLSTLPDDGRPKVLEYHLARCLLKRGAAGDKERALKHARKAAGRGLAHDFWLLLLNLECAIHGINAALPVITEARRYLSAHQNMSALYQRGAELLTQSSRINEAIDLLMKGIDFLTAEKRLPPLHQSRAELVQACANLMALSGRWAEAINLLQITIDDIKADENVSAHYQSLIELTRSCAEILSRSNEDEKAIELLKDSIKEIPVETNLFSLYQSCAEMMAQANRLDDAIKLLEKGIAVTPADKGLVSLYQSCAEMMAQANRLDDAIKLLEKGIAVPGMASLVSLYQSCAEMMAQANRLDDAIKLLEKGIAVTPADKGLVSLYQSCAEMMAQANRLDDAVKKLEEGIEKVPADKNLFVLYQTAIELAGKTEDYKRAETLAAKGLATIPRRYGRHKIADTALRMFGARCEAEAIRGLQGLSGTAQLDPPQRLLADYLLIRISGDWAKAAEVAHKGQTDFPNHMALQTSEVDARLALGQVTEADDLMKEYPVGGEKQVRDNSVVWLKAYVSLMAGRPDEARTLAMLYAPNEIDSGRPLDEAELLRLWSVARNGMNGPVEDNFPGLAEYRRQNTAQAPEAEQSPVAQTPAQLCVLVVATEWDSRHGGLSTFNRDLCAALAGAGARVVCYVPQASGDEVERAKRVHVRLVEARTVSGSQGVALLSQRPDLPSDFVPDLIIGHDRITGAPSVILARDHYPASRRVLFIHTSPEEIEWHKEPRSDSTSADRAAARKQEQLGLAQGCDLVVAVGAHLKREFGTDLLGIDNPPPIIELTPGLPESPQRGAMLPPSIRCLILGRAEDYTLKGLDLAARALGRVVERWRNSDSPKLIVRGAPTGTGDALRQRIIQDGQPASLDVVVRHYTPYETEIRSDLQEASLVLMPSQKEGFGLVGLEAIAWGVPTLISDRSGLAETLKRYAPQRASAWILPVTGDADIKWAERIELLLTAREDAFASAAALRQQLTTMLDWRNGAAALLDKLFPKRIS
jgi:glycosyltransferase involved in cell wall biosynthesis/predicted Zn-dependent protease